MNQRKVYMVLALIIAILALGIAYAAIATQTLRVGGNITAATSDENFNVKFEGTIVKWVDIDENGREGTVDAYIDAKDTTGRTVVMNVSNLTTRGDIVRVYIPVKNKSQDIWADVTCSATNTNKEWFTVSSWMDWDSENNFANDDLPIGPGETKYVGVDVELKDTPATDAEVALAKDTITVTLSANATTEPDEY